MTSAQRIPLLQNNYNKYSHIEQYENSTFLALTLLSVLIHHQSSCSDLTNYGKSDTDFEYLPPMEYGFCRKINSYVGQRVAM